MRSVIQHDFKEKLDTGYFCIHHVFQGKNRKKCEKYGFLVAIRPDLHDLVHKNTNTGISLIWKQKCQRYYEEHIGKRTDFIREFGRSFL